MEHVPENVYYDTQAENFRHQLTGKAMGAAFWKEWEEWRELFPTARPSIPTVKACKKCAEPAQPIGKQLCLQHAAELHVRKVEQAKRFAALPNCREFAECGNKVPLQSVERGIVLCRQCEADFDRLERERWQWRQDQYAKEAKARQLQEVKTLDDLKAWITKHMLEK